MAAIILLLGLMAQIVTPIDTTCIGFISEVRIPMDVYIAGTEIEGSMSASVTNGLLYLNGPGIQQLKKGDIYQVVRPEGEVADPYSREHVGTYYKELGTARIEQGGKDYAVAIVASSCQHMIKGDILVPPAPKAAAGFQGKLSDRLTPFVENGLQSYILLGKDDLRELAAGHFCFIGIGSENQVKAGDRFTIYRVQPPLNPQDLAADGQQMNVSYGKMEGGHYRVSLAQVLNNRTLPPRPIGDLVVVDVREKTAAAKIINSLYEIHPGDIVVRRQ
jgi:hypothetical protein